MAQSLKAVVAVVDPASRSPLVGILRISGFEVAEVPDGTEALRLASVGSDLVVVAARLPDLDGREVCRRIKAEGSAAAVLLLRDDEGPPEGLADVELTPPIAPETLLAAVFPRLLRRAETPRPEPWQAALDAARDGVALLDRAGCIVRCNPSMAALLGLVAGEAPGRSFAEATSRSIPRLEQPSTRSLKSRKPVGGEWEFDGRWLRISADPLQDDSGEPTGLIVLASDVTEERRLRARAAEAEAEGREAERRIESLERDARLYEQFGPIRAPAPQGESIRSAAQQDFCELASEFEALIDRMLEQKEFLVNHREEITGRLRGMAGRLSALGAGPRDVVDLHGSAIRRKGRGEPSAKVRAIAEEGRILVLELMGHLVSTYRPQAPGSPAATRPHEAERRKASG